MSLINKFKEEMPRLYEMLEENGLEMSTIKLDKILEETEDYKFKKTKISNSYEYEAFINESNDIRILLDSISMPDYNGKIDENTILSEGDNCFNFFSKEIDEKNKFIFEISEISDTFIAHILNDIIHSNNKEYKFNLYRMMRSGIYLKNKPYHKSSMQINSFEDIIIFNFKERFRTLKIKSKEKMQYSNFKKLKNSYMIDFMCKFNVALTTQTKDQSMLYKTRYITRKRLKPDLLDIVPNFYYDENLVIKFKKAMSSEDTETKFLSFYHILEYNYDKLFNARIVKEMKKWINDQTMSLSNDDVVLKLVDKAVKLRGRSKEDGQGNEFDALLNVLEEIIDLDKVKYKLEKLKKDEVKNEYNISINEENMLEYYSKNSVDFLDEPDNNEKYRINFNCNKNKTLQNIRERIYTVRNALVHNKNNYKYKTYNPYDNENTLMKEIPLIKILAIEIIVNTSEKIS